MIERSELAWRSKFAGVAAGAQTVMSVSVQSRAARITLCRKLVSAIAGA